MPSSIRNGGNDGLAAEAELGSSKDRTWQMRKYLLLLAILVATVTYAAGIDPPGGVWLETDDGHRAGDPILPDTRRIRYEVFYHVNAAALAASLVIIVLLLFLRKDGMRMLLAVRFAMALELVCLVLAYITGACRGTAITVVASALSAAVILVVVVAIWLQHGADKQAAAAVGAQRSRGGGGHFHREGRKILMLVSIFATTATYTAGLNPPGGFWEDGHGHSAGDPILLERRARYFLAFLVCNTTAFAASLVTMTLLLSRQLSKVSGHLIAPYVCVAVALIGQLGAYAAGSSRETDTAAAVDVLCLVGVVVVCISIVAYIENQRTLASSQAPEGGGEEGSPEGERSSRNGVADRNPLDKARSLILLLATLMVTVTYQAGLNPPGGVWKENGDGHVGGGLVLHETHTKRYTAFFYCNSAAFVASIVVFIMVQSRSLVSQGGRHALEAAVVLDLLALIGAYAAGSCRDVRTSIFVFALAAVVFVYVVIHVVIEKSSSDSTATTAAVTKEEVELEKKRKLLLLLAILVVTITYQAGLTPPGKFWLQHGHGSGDEAHEVGYPVMANNYPWRYRAFFYSNSTSFMASVAVTVFLLSRDLSNTGTKYWTALYFCMGAGFIGLMCAYTASTMLTMRESFIFVVALVSVVVVFTGLHAVLHHGNVQRWISRWRHCCPSDNHNKTGNSGNSKPKHCASVEYRVRYRMCKYLMLLGILAASVTYQAGLTPPGGEWLADGNGHGGAAGDPVLHDTDNRRYRTFFYSNSASFVASVIVIVVVPLLMQGALPAPASPMPVGAMYMVVVLDLLGLLLAYATGSSRDWATSWYVLGMAATVLAYVAIYKVLSSRGRRGGNCRQQPDLQQLSIC